MKKKTKENVRNVEEWHLDLGLCKKKVLRKQTKKNTTQINNQKQINTQKPGLPVKQMQDINCKEQVETMGTGYWK